MAERLTKSGYCVYQLMYGLKSLLPGMPEYGGITDIHESTKELSAFVDKVLKSSGASQVDLIGHSEGSVVARWYVKFLGGDKKVRSVISISPVGRGTTLQGLLSVFEVFTGGFVESLESLVGTLCPACLQILEDSDLLNELYADDQETVPGVRYLNILTREDQAVTPYTNAAMKLEVDYDDSYNSNSNSSSTTVDAESSAEEPQELSQNVIVEDYCQEAEFAAKYANHVALFRSPFAVNAVEAFLGKKELLGKEDLPCTSS
ncbi:hypothetical protein BGZ67_009207 [Mortierella alpina]|nr:hypothetical protein BGZ67_009207 [Mortierella alpina]